MINKYYISIDEKLTFTTLVNAWSSGVGCPILYGFDLTITFLTNIIFKTGALRFKTVGNLWTGCNINFVIKNIIVFHLKRKVEQIILTIWYILNYMNFTSTIQNTSLLKSY